ncbi:MAG: hypothetical protein ACR2OF_06450 [Hyphomicrobium sp.]
MKLVLPFWQRLVITILVVIGISYLAGIIWQWIFGFALPSYAAGIIGGLAALPLWDFLKRIRPAPEG